MLLFSFCRDEKRALEEKLKLVKEKKKNDNFTCTNDSLIWFKPGPPREVVVFSTSTKATSNQSHAIEEFQEVPMDLSVETID